MRRVRRSRRGGKPSPVKRKDSPALRRTKATSQVARILSRFEQTFHTLTTRGAELLATAHRIEDEAVERHASRLSRELAEAHLLRDILALRQAFSAAPTGTLNDTVEGLRTLPDSLLGWLEERLEVTPYLGAEQQLEVPVSALGGFGFDGKPPAGDRPLVRLRVLTPGWKRRGATLVPPTVEWLTD